MAKTVRTVTGPVAIDALGGVLAHEHFVYGFPGYTGDISFDAFNREEYLAKAMESADKVKAQGIKTIVDATTNECGRDPLLLREVSEKTGLNIICSTGFYSEEDSSGFYFGFRAMMGFDVDEEIYGLLRHELYEGIAGTGVCAGVIKLASSRDAITPYEQRFFRAGCRLANADPDLRLITHTSAGTCLMDQAALFLENGVNPKQVQIGHFCGTTDVETQKKVLEKGFYCAFDRFGLEGILDTPTDRERLECIYQLVKSGYGDRIMISFDKPLQILGRSTDLPDGTNLFPNQEWDHAVGRILPALREMGLSDTETHRLVFENPAAFYAGS